MRRATGVWLKFTSSLTSLTGARPKAYIEQAIEANDCRLRKAAEALDIHYSALLTKMKRNGISLKRHMEATHGS